MLGPKLVEGLERELLVRLRVRDLLEALHSLLVRDSLRLEARDEFPFALVDLFVEDGARILQDGLDEGEGVEHEVGVVFRENLERFHQVQ